MINEIDSSFKEYIEAFKKMDIQGKRKEIIQNINEITAMFDMLAKESNIQLSYLKTDEVTKLNEGNKPEDVYLDALLVYIENAKSVMGQYLLNIDKTA